MINQEIMINYLNQIRIERQLFNKYTLINTGKMPSENFNKNIMPKLSKRAQDYGFRQKIINMICSLDETNRNIIRVNQAWESVVNADEESMIFNTRNNFIIDSANAHIIHDIRHFIDDVISIIWILNQSEVVRNVAVDCIGKYLHNNTYTDFNIFTDFFIKVNDIENAYKHSFPNNMSSLIGRDEPCIFALDAKRNTDFFNPEIIGISLKKLIEEFNRFYKFSMKLIEEKQ